VRVATSLGALLLAATFMPVNGGGAAGYPYAILDTSIQRELLLFAAEPLAVAVCAVLAAVFLLGRHPRITAGMLLAFGLQTGLLFLAHLGAAAFGNPAYNSFRPAGLVGLAGAAALLAAGALALAHAPKASSSRR